MNTNTNIYIDLCLEEVPIYRNLPSDICFVANLNSFAPVISMDKSDPAPKLDITETPRPRERQTQIPPPLKRATTSRPNRQIIPLPSLDDDEDLGDQTDFANEILRSTSMAKQAPL